MSLAKANAGEGEQDLATLLRELCPKRHAGIYRFATLATTDDIDFEQVLCIMHEPEGISIIVRESALPPGAVASELRCCWITLEVRSSLAAVGLTAAVSSVLAEADIPCNIVAGTRHDHLFVPVNQADQAMVLLEALQWRPDPALEDGTSS